jgi:crossover junction endodeoxyribonuclease RusA
MQITLPWPDKRLSPNARVHWATLSEVKRAARAEGFALAREALGRSAITGPLHVSLTFHPPTRRRADLDNMLSSCKAVIDGISQAVGVDDSEWSLSLRKGEPTKSGCVVVTLSACIAQNAV